MLEEEEEYFIQELATKQALEDCGYCKERNERTEKIEEEIEKKKIAYCQKALEREKIAKGMPRTREEERRLREFQKMQIMERSYMDQEEQDMEVMWHRVLLDEVRKKERLERREEERRRREMIERRNAYDEQIASANRQRQEALREEREKENRRLERMKKKMEQDHFDAIKRKKEQQMVNKKNFIEGHQDKLARLRQEKQKEREIDNKTIHTALEELNREKLRKIMEMRNLQTEKKVFTENVNRERKRLDELEMEADKVAADWKNVDEERNDQRYKNMEDKRRLIKQIENQEYRKLIEERNNQIQRERQERRERMVLVRNNAILEIQRKLDNANEAIRKQVEFRNELRSQIMENQRFMENEANEFEYKDKPFTRKADMFKDTMTNRYRMSSARIR
ncbi:capping protein inhibiting regulator of actin dynamics-like isoform X2 [Plodia interpunctella]|uniref:capping protein inhibiting regulator of actin dynamics-like isoform X2 n=1 Tax=Plodia interpunctella TaxID=58824 RepID=UPI002367EE30|nr:capping protein inhibiting regulator of actin dynamics-like isoform X2 [Plodia interpunctella]